MRPGPAPIAVAVLGLLAATAVALALGVRPAIPAEGRDWLLAAVFAPLGARIAAHERRNPCGWLLLAVGVLGGVTVVTSLAGAGPVAWVRDWVWWPGYGLLVLVVALFPDGRRSRVLVAGLAVNVLAGTVALAALMARSPGSAEGNRVAPGWDGVVFLAASAVLAAGGLAAVAGVLVRIRRCETRGPLLWCAGNGVLLLLALALDVVGSVPVTWLAGVLAIPLATVVGIMRYGLYDIRLPVHRGLLYGTLSIAVLLVYAATVTVVARLLPVAATPVAVAAALLTLLPLRQRLQSALTRRLYGRPPYELVTVVGRGADLPSVVAGLGEGLRVPYAAVRVDDAEVSHGRRRAWPVTELPLHPGGVLVVQQRAPDEPWTRRENELLSDLAAQLGPAVAATRVREESRRLQRDLHDGIGPALFGARMLVRAGRTRSAEAPGLAQTWDDLEDGLAAATAEIRRILDGLGPAALERGLAAALDGVARRHRGAGLPVTLQLPADLTGLSGAVEVAAYRIVDEALTNVARHARAASATVTVTRDGAALGVTVEDDGAGIAADRAAGLGLGSLRERCARLGGTFAVEAGALGTRLSATLPAR
ncbi:sensor histidine kinase [Paractinoplanes rishiriensis]|uniref:histidine kinase n=1 Tax=Paractinoplanes rishiriensis TaxID=1050105 RepID=A0A919K5S4_9ACTN|nr:ATP-binding protein [Actinoplanes rishiriensis]GIE99842.1 hypothetical protein Ari01nite_73070 [Actinoplanes rishiriensis]